MSRLATTVVTIAPYTTTITETTSDEITVNRVQTNTTDVAVEYFFAKFSAADIAVDTYNTITATNAQDALEQLADQHFVQSSQPSGVNVEEGDLWYNTLTNNLYVYRETSTDNFEWVAIASATGDMDTLDGDTFV